MNNITPVNVKYINPIKIWLL